MTKPDRPRAHTSPHHLSVDIETLSTSRDPLPAVFEIGLVLFDPTGPGPLVIRDEIQLSCSPFDAIAEGFHVDPDTIRFHQSRRGTIRDTSNTLRKILCDAFHIIQSWEFDFIWAKAPDFDLHILSALFQHYEISPCPWRYWQSRDVRTIQDFTEGETEEVPHTALEDARIQAVSVSKILQAHRPIQRAELPEINQEVAS